MEELLKLAPELMRQRALALCFKGKLGQTTERVDDTHGQLGAGATLQEHVERFEQVLTTSNTRLPLTSLAITYC